jgi:two-component sensor histidine kinase
MQKPEIRRLVIEIFLIFCLCFLIFQISSHFELFERFAKFSSYYEHWQLDEIFSVIIFLNIVFIILLFKRWMVIRKINITKSRLLKENKIILKEVHHRIKNNMNIISGLLEMQSNSIDSPVHVNVFNDAISRIESMRVLYDRLYITEDYGVISTRDYLQQLVENVCKIFSEMDSIKFELNIDNFDLDIKTLSSIGIIVNEMLTNALKYAFPEKEDGLIKISLHRIGSQVTIIFSDNGIGIGDSKSRDQNQGFGLHLFQLLAEQIGADFKIENENGTKFIIEFDL